MQIWVDADACPLVVKEILYRAAERLQLETTLVANKPLRTPRSMGPGRHRPWPLPLVTQKYTGHWRRT